jgi:hypothetical protein
LRQWTLKDNYQQKPILFFVLKQDPLKTKKKIGKLAKKKLYAYLAN